MTVARRRAWLFVALVSAASASAAAQPLACASIRPGETAALAAARITGDARNRYAEWFQIVDPATRQVMAKSQYGLVRAGWSACIVDVRPRPASFAGTMAAAASTLDAIDSTYLSWALLVLLIAVAIHGADDYVTERRAVARLLTTFGETFVREFERPLVRSQPSGRVIDARLRLTPHRSRVDVLLAPRDGRPYPNLADHRKNLEYDVRRVLQLMQDPPFIPQPMRAEGRWVVVPFQLKVNPRQAGDR